MPVPADHDAYASACVCGRVSSKRGPIDMVSGAAGLFDAPLLDLPEDGRALCEALIRADTEAEVEAVLTDAGYWDDIDAWSVFGANPANASVIGGQQEAPEAALVEKIVNSIDARLLDACRQRDLDPRSVGGLPTSGLEAVSSWFDHGMNTSQVSRAGNVIAWAPGKRDAQADRITVAATGSTDGYASISIADDGEGQEPDDFAATFCSLNTGNKRSIPFVQGKHTMGGTGALRFCGAGRVHARNLQLVVSRRNAAYASAGDETPWGFTVVRRFPKEISRSKASEDQAADLRHQFGVVMAALGLAVMGAHQRSANGQSDHDDSAENGKPEMSVNELIEWCTSAAAPVVASIRSLTTASLSNDDGD